MTWKTTGNSMNRDKTDNITCIIVVLKTHTDTVHLFSKVASTTYKRQFKSSAFRYEYYYQDT